MRSNIPQRASRTTSQNYPVEEDEEDDGYTTNIPRSTIRYPIGRPYTFQQGNRRIVVHPQPPPRKIHWLFYVGVGMVIAASVWLASAYLTNWWTNTQNDQTYTQAFRTFSIDYAVGHNGDSEAHPSHFIVQNDKRHIIIIELPADDFSKALIYSAPTLIGNGQERTPATLSFQVNVQTGRVDMVLHVQDQTYVFTNNGTKFITPSGQ